MDAIRLSLLRMQPLTDLWPLILQAHQTAVQSIAQAYRAEFERLRGRFQTDDPGVAGRFVYLVENFNPQRLSAADYQRRDPFDHPEVVSGWLEDAAARGWLDPNGDGSYRMTGEGHAIRDLRWRIVNPLLARQNLLPPAGMEQLLAQLGHVVEATAAARQPRHPWAFQTRRRYGLQLPPGSAPLLWLIHYRMDLGAFRDDVHLAAWRELHQVSPLAWEMITLLWSGQADSTEGLAQSLGRRGFAPADHAAALDDLQQRGWISQGKEGRWQMTDEGQQVRDAAEARTNEWFYAPWAIVSNGEAERCRRLLAAFGSHVSDGA
jgi:hypothetical protein